MPPSEEREQEEERHAERIHQKADQGEDDQEVVSVAGAVDGGVVSEQAKLLGRCERRHRRGVDRRGGGGRDGEVVLATDVERVAGERLADLAANHGVGQNHALHHEVLDQVVLPLQPFRILAFALARFAVLTLQLAPLHAPRLKVEISAEYTEHYHW